MSNVRRHEPPAAMQSLSKYEKQPRGARLVDIWSTREPLRTELGPISTDLCCDLNAAPSSQMIDLASELAAYAQAQSSYLLDLIYSHYRFAQSNGWLVFWKVPVGLERHEVLGQVEDVRLSVHQDLFACVHVDPRWDPEHKLSLDYSESAIRRIDGQQFSLQDGELVLL
jgi:hypothetical protein